MRLAKSLRTWSTPWRCITCITTSAGFTNPCELRQQWKQGLAIRFGIYLSLEYGGATVGGNKGKAAYYRDVLFKNGMITGIGMIVGDDLGSYELTPKGREFAVESGLV